MTAVAVVIGVACGVGGVLVSEHVRVAAGGAITLGTTLALVVSVLVAPLVRRGAAVRRQALTAT